MYLIGKTAVLALLVGVGVAGCNYERMKQRPAEPVRESWYGFLHRTILEPRCVSCHSGPGAKGGVDMMSHETLMASGAVVPRDPARSALFVVVRDGDMPRPMSAPRLTAKQVRDVEKWIRAGASATDPRPETDSQNDDPVTPPPVVSPLEPTFASLKQHVFDARCVKCHSGPKPKAGLDLSDYDKLMKADVVVPGVPGDSALYERVSTNDEDMIMPPKPPPLTAPEIETIRVWIERGAPRG